MNTDTTNPEMVVIARESRGMTQRQLSEKTGIAQSKLSKYENGLLAIDDVDIERIGDATGFSKSFFACSDRVIGLGSSLIFNRKQKTTPVRVQRQVQARVNITRMHIERLLRAVEVESAARIERLDVDEYDGDAREVARRVRASLRIPMGPIQSITHAIESAGGLVVLCNFETRRIDGAHLWLPEHPPLFFMNADTPGDRHRFNLAHELAHAVMHEFPAGDVEKQANEFASEFLMPSNEIRKELYDLTIERAASLKQRWRVSMSAIIYTAHQLGCITDRRKQYLYAKLKAQIKNRVEPIEIPFERPVLVDQLLATHRAALGYSDDDFRSLFMMNDPDFIVLGDDVDLEPKPFKIDRGPLKFSDYKFAAEA